MTLVALPLSDVDRFMLASKAVYAISCPKCEARPGQHCQSTGGGNPADVAAHKARRSRIADWSDQQLLRFAGLVRQQGSTQWWQMPDGYYAASEAAAAPIHATAAKQPTPKGVRLSEVQAERIEWAAQAGGQTWTSTGHLHGEVAGGERHPDQGCAVRRVQRPARVPPDRVRVAGVPLPPADHPPDHR